MLQRLDEKIEDERFRSELKQSLKQLSNVKFALDESSIVAVTDGKGKIQYVNDKFCEISQYERIELIGHDHRIINSGLHDKEFMRSLWETIKSGEVWFGEIRNRAKDGSYYWVNTTIVPFIGDDGVPYQFLAIRNEVTKLKRVEEELQEMMTQVMQIQENERRKFSRELHDGIGQSLFSLLIGIDRLIAGKEDGESELAPLRQNVADIIEDVRGLAWELRPSVLDDLGVVPAIRTYIDNYSSHYGINVQFDCSLRGRLDVLKETAIYRVIQEALTNIAKYADVSEAAVSIHQNETAIAVRIIDHGAGFDPAASFKGVGRFSMEERARAVGGKFQLLSQPSQGTEVRLTIPISANNL
nr:PAS domain-containing protein [Paenibacillus oenotherae]